VGKVLLIGVTMSPQLEQVLSQARQLSPQDSSPTVRIGYYVIHVWMIFMQYQVFIQSDADLPEFHASVLEMPSVSGTGATEVEAVINVKAALKEKLAAGKFVMIDLDIAEETPVELPGAGIFAEDPTFDDWMERLAAIRRTENAMDAVE
jgi:predicted RNase H-like HicB family nuclease